MPTRNQIATKVANAIGQPFNQELIERIKDSSKWVLATLIRQQVEKHGLNDILLQSYIVPVSKTTTIYPCFGQSLDCEVLKTINPIETPIAFYNDAPFTFVGTTDRRPFAYINPSSARHQEFLRFPLVNVYNYTNKHIILLNNTLITNILVESIFENPDALIASCSCESDEVELPISADLLMICNTELLKEYSALKVADPTINQE